MSIQFVIYHQGTATGTDHWHSDSHSDSGIELSLIGILFRQLPQNRKLWQHSRVSWSTRSASLFPPLQPDTPQWRTAGVLTQKSKTLFRVQARTQDVDWGGAFHFSLVDLDLGNVWKIHSKFHHLNMLNNAFWRHLFTQNKWIKQSLELSLDYYTHRKIKNDQPGSHDFRIIGDFSVNFKLIFLSCFRVFIEDFNLCFREFIEDFNLCFREFIEDFILEWLGFWSMFQRVYWAF